MILVGLTGGIAAGKSTVGARLASLGAVVIDTDQVAHRHLQPEGKAVQPILERFGSQVSDGKGGIDRDRLGQIVFADDEARHDLESIVHPLVIDDVAEEVFQYSETDKVVVVEVPLLVEIGLDAIAFDSIVTVESSRSIVSDRLAARGFNDIEVASRIAALATSDERREIADFIIENDGSVDDLNAAVDDLWSSLKSVAE